SLALASLVYGVAVAVGMVLCIIPGLVAAFFLAFVPYLVSTQGLDIGASLTRSVELAQKHVVPLLIAVAIYVVVALGVIAAIAVLTFIANAALGPAAGAAFTSPVSFLISTIASYVGWLFFASALVTIDAAESGTEIVRYLRRRRGGRPERFRATLFKGCRGIRGSAWPTRPPRCCRPAGPGRP
ncbi:MAG TPA: hypothetical protein RMF84_07400, partial [Polyangiaceae bacterium LLY-WYZ-14_1]|nr:hypothetical protein [Polyangiaceae bacterium LLY-WYZ-14_1]